MSDAPGILKEVAVGPDTPGILKEVAAGPDTPPILKEVAAGPDTSGILKEVTARPYTSGMLKDVAALPDTPGRLKDVTGLPDTSGILKDVALPPEALPIAAKAFKTSSGFCMFLIWMLISIARVAKACGCKILLAAHNQTTEHKMMKRNQASCVWTYTYIGTRHVTDSGVSQRLNSTADSSVVTSINFPCHLRLAGLLVLCSVRGLAKDLSSSPLGTAQGNTASRAAVMAP